ncbi:hypothetical protein Zmor_012570 [Zophobas morio]|uniref:SCP domain-containing protein n=1 Tax=Zophobas morio TaxID=2755281 RepID=A0AA38IBQ2_9CUCU|nr:hypothetical protein Zmor_012570 [Zophobas morio]
MMVNFHNYFRTKVVPNTGRYIYGAMVLTTHTKTPNALFRSRLFIIRTWYRKKDNFTYSSTSNDFSLVGYYTHMVWASTHCLSRATGETFYNYICNYCPM